jgi:Tfp pilus assembly protein PilN
MVAPNELSFLPDDYLERKARRRTNTICAILFCVVIGAIASAFWVTEKGMREIEGQANSVNQQYTEAARKIEQFQQLQEKQRTMAHQAELTSSLLEKVPRSFILAEITNGMPEGVSLLDLMMESRVITNVAAAPKTAFEIRKAEIGGAGAAPTVQARVYEVTLKATGVAENDVQVSQFIRKLNKSTLLKDVNLLFTDEFAPGQKDGPRLRKFQLELKLNPDAKVDPNTVQPKSLKQASISLEGK